MKKLIIALCFFVAVTARAQTPTATATATDTPTATPSATATATATATGTPVPTPTPLAVLYRQDTQNQKKALELQQVDADRVTVTNDGLAAKVSGPQDVASTSDTHFNTTRADAGIYIGDSGFITLLGVPSGKFRLGSPNGSFAPLNYLLFEDNRYVQVRSSDETGGILFNTSGLSATRVRTEQDKDGTPAMLDDIAAIPTPTPVPAHNIIGETHFNPADLGAASVFGNVSGVTSGSTGSYSINFTNALADTNYGVTIGAGDDPSRILSANFNTTASDVNACVITVTKFNPGILGVALPSYDAFDPLSVTVVVYKNP